MHVARELKMTLSVLCEIMTEEELALWACYFEIENEEIEKLKKKR